MPDYMTLPASAYPPNNWTFVPNRWPRHQPSQTSTNRHWVEMTYQYQRSMAIRQHTFHSNFLSETTTLQNFSRMSPDVRRLCIQQRLYNRRSVAAFQATAEVVDVLDNAGSFTRKMDNLRKRPMETIPEGEALEIEPAIKDAQTDEQLLKHFRPRPAQTGHVEEETNAHVALAQEQLTTDVAHLGDFLRGRLFDQYCLMRETPMDQKDRTWLKYGECIIAGHGNCDPEVEDRLHRMINESGLDPKWVMDHIEGYHNGNEHIGHWQGYVRSRRWMNLAEKFTKDTQQLQRINSTRPMNSRRCNIMFNILSTTRLYFKRLDGPLGYELSDKACKMEREEDDES